MIVALDVGNTNIRLGIVRGGDVTSARRVPTDPATTVGGVEQALSTLVGEDGATLHDIDQIVLVSVVPPVAAVIAELAAHHGMRLLVASCRTIHMPIRVDRPEQVGNDRLVNAYAAARLHGVPAIVVDMGTATTFDVVAADGAFVGGAIAAGAGLGVEALATHTAQLPRVALLMPPRAIGRDTVSAMQSGSVIGHIGLIGELIRAIAAELMVDSQTRPSVILTGGLSSAPWAADIVGVDAVDPLLTLRGLAIFHAEVASSALAPAEVQA